MSEFLTLVRRLLYGANDMEIRVQSVVELVLLELLNPFYVFQIFSLGVWFSEGYYYYTIAIIIMSTFGITFTVRQTRRVSWLPTVQRHYHVSEPSLELI